MATVEEIQAVNGRAQGVATILAIGTANPSNHVYQADFPDYYFRVTNSEDKIMLKDKFKRICEKSMIEKRYVHLTEETMKENPDMCAYSALSLNARLDFVIKEVPEFGERAATKAIKEWGQPISNITHLVFNASSGIDMPGVDIQLVRALGLKPSVKRVTLYHLGCYAGGTVIRIAKDLAENNTNARVLVVTSEITTFSFRGPCDDMSRLVAQAIFGDGAAAMIIGAEDSLLSSERPLFRVVSTLQNIIPYSEGAIQGHIREVGNTVYISPEVPKLISDNLEKYLVDAFSQFGISDWNSLFWVPHPGGPAILQEIEKKVGLEKDKLKATWHVLKEYGNMSSATVLFILDEMRKKSIQDGKTTTGEGLEWGVLFGFGPGLTVETVVLQSFPIAYD